MIVVHLQQVVALVMTKAHTQRLVVHVSDPLGEYVLSFFWLALWNRMLLSVKASKRFDARQLYLNILVSVIL